MEDSQQSEEEVVVEPDQGNGANHQRQPTVQLTN